ncbi:MAG: peptidoglycan-associated lipoprotein [Desulfobulbaceae bacterium A2]|nr:MAG: peptidoglycan-associated lipoprotein [Desulfobulbaceae bacterium A2]
MNRVIKSGFVMGVLMLSMSLAACGKKAPESAPAAAPAAKAPAESLDTKSSDLMEGRTSPGMFPVYFDYDKSDIRGDQKDRVEKNAAFLKQNDKARIRIEGNCDPRGTKEYNLALGERRAQSAKKYLAKLGVGAARMDTVSWGEEKLLLHGHDELSYAQNRRDDFVIIK